VQYLDRYLNTSKKVLQLNDLHEIGATCMFVASKYEEITPLFMRTMVSKIGHGMIPKSSILARERDIVMALGFKMSVLPTVFEFLETYLTSASFKDHPEAKFLNIMAVYLAKLALHHIQFCTLLSSELAAACIYVALSVRQRILEKNVGKDAEGPFELPSYIGEEVNRELAGLAKCDEN